MKIVLTGANGNLGRELMKKASFQFLQVNREDWNDLDVKLACGVDAVVHAASDHRTRPAESPISLVDSNLLTTARLLEGMRKHKIPRFIFISSCSVYGEGMNTHEASECRPVSINGIGKLLNEKLIEEFCSENRIKYEIYRVFNLYGGQDRFSILSKIKKSLECNQPFILNNRGVAQRDFIHVSDVAGIILFLLEKGASFTHLNIGTGTTTKISTVVDLVEQIFPSLLIDHREVEEVEYSRANVSRLSSLVKWNFVRIEDYIRSEFMPQK